MTEENMKLLLDGIPLETQKEEQGTSYYIYTDNTKKNFIRIFTDKDLGLIREIELSNSPEETYLPTRNKPLNPYQNHFRWEKEGKTKSTM